MQNIGMTPVAADSAAMAADAAYVGRFAPSPTGPLHRGSLAAALASWLDARAHGGQWLVRIEDVDGPRCRPGAEETILAQLAACGLHADRPVIRQRDRAVAYQRALDVLRTGGLAYPCACSRRAVEEALVQRGMAPERHAERIYPGTCRAGIAEGTPAGPRAWRLRVPAGAAAHVDWVDRRLGAHSEAVDRTVGDFVLLRADGMWAYQLAVVVDDAGQGVTDVVRGEDLADSTARQVLLQRMLGLATPRYLHVPLVRDEAGEKLSKQTGAAAFVPGPAALAQAMRDLGLGSSGAATVPGLLADAVDRWRASWGEG